MQRSEEFSIIENMLLILNSTDNNNADGELDPETKLSNVARKELDTAQKIKEFLDGIPGGFLIYNADNAEQIVYANTALIKIFGCKTFTEFMELTNGTFRGIVHPGDLDRVEKSIADQIKSRGDNLDYVEYRITRKDGIVRWVEDYGHFVRGEKSGNFFYVFISDATEKVTRRMAETATLIYAGQQKEQQLQSLIEEYDRERKLIRQEHLQRLEVIEGLSINYDSILYADLNSNKVLPYRLSSRLEHQFEKKLQVRELDWFLNDYVKVWVHPDDRNRIKEQTSVKYMRNMLKTVNTYYLNYRCVKDGELQYIQLRIVNVGEGNTVSQVVMGYRNVDEEVLQGMKQKQLLEAALKNAKIADDAKNTFLSNMSHDMRTPLNAIFGFIALARNNVNDGAAVTAYLDKIEVAGKQILDLVDKVLALSYTESKNYSVQEAQCNILDTVRNVYDSILPTATAKNIDMRLSVNDLRHEEVITDQSKLHQVLSHIINNAVKYTRGGGKVHVTLSEHTEKSGEYSTYVFEITDTGVGIPEDLLPKIFNPFFRASNTTASGVYGVGLGLTISKQIMQALGGDITVESELNKGSKFTVTVGLKTPTKTTDDTRSDMASPIGKKILIVEDNIINLEIETDILTDLGFDVDSAANGKIAVDKITDATPDEYALVLMDIQMPVMDGREATRKIRKLPDKKKSGIPIIALSANAFESDKRDSINAGMNAHLTKPIDIPVLLDEIQKVLK